jgi:hypothetical protein
MLRVERLLRDGGGVLYGSGGAERLLAAVRQARAAVDGDE